MNIAAFFQLVRLPNIFTAMADILAGYFLSGAAGQPLALVALLGASAALYGGGCALNDYQDRHEDRRLRPERPIPAGDITPGAALTVALVLFGLALICGMAADGHAPAITMALLGLILAYDCGVKRFYLAGALTMGCCRGANLLLGASLVPLSPHVTVAAFCSLAYVTALTMVADQEEKKPAAGAVTGALLLCIGLLLFFIVFSGRQPYQVAGIAFLVLFAGVTLPPLLACRRTGTGIHRAVRRMILGIVVLDGYYAAGQAGVTAGLLVLALLGPAILLKKKIVMT